MFDQSLNSKPKLVDDNDFLSGDIIDGSVREIIFNDEIGPSPYYWMGRHWSPGGRMILISANEFDSYRALGTLDHSALYGIT